MEAARLKLWLRPLMRPSGGQFCITLSANSDPWIDNSAAEMLPINGLLVSQHGYRQALGVTQALMAFAVAKADNPALPLVLYSHKTLFFFDLFSLPDYIS